MKILSILIATIILNASCQPQGQEWVSIPLPADKTAVFPFLNNGNEGLLLSWIETVKDTVDILKVAKGDSLGFYEVTEVSRGSDWFVNWADFPKVCQFKDGKYITHWLQKSTTSTYDYNIHVAIGDFGNREPDTSFILHDDGIDAEHGFVSFLPLGDEILTVWLDGRESKNPDGTHGQMTLRSAIIDNKGGKSDDQLIDGRICDCCQTDLAMIDGKPVMVYRDRSHDEVRDNYFAVFDNRKWSEGIPIHDDGWIIPGCPVNGPAITGSGLNGAAAWYTERDGKGVVKVARMQNDEKIYFDTNVEIEGVLGRVDIKMTKNGKLVFIWMEKNGDKGVLKINTIDTGSNIGKEQIVDFVDSSRNSGFPHLVIDGTEAYISYTSSDESTGISLRSLNLNSLQ